MIIVLPGNPIRSEQTCLVRSNTNPKRGNLHIPPPRHPNRLPINIRKIRTRNTQNRPRRLLRTSRPTQRNIRISIRLGALLPVQLLPRDPEGDLRSVRGGDEGAGFLRGRETGGYVAEGDGVGAHAKGRAPFFGDCAGESDDAGFGDGVVCLAPGLWLDWGGG